MNQAPSKKSKMKRKGNDFRPNPSFNKESASPRSPYVGDPRLVPRIQQYLDSRPDNQVINVVTMAGELQDKYPAYARKKRIAFVKQVEKAYNIICAEDDLEDIIEDSSCSLEEKHLAKRRKQTDDGPDNDDSDTSASLSDNAEYVTYKDTNSVNSLLTNLYNKNTPGSRPSTPGSKPNSRPRSPVSQPGSRSPNSFPGQSETLRNKPKLNDKIKGEKQHITTSNGKRKPSIGQKNVETPEAKDEDDIIEMWTIDRNGDIQDQSSSQKTTPKGLKNPTKQLPGASKNKSGQGPKVGPNTKAGPSSKTGTSSIITTDLSSVSSSQVLNDTPTICSTSMANILDEKVLAQQLMPHIQYITPETAALKTTEFLRKNMSSSQEQLLKNPNISNIIDIADSAPSTPKSSFDDGVETPSRKNENEAYMSLKTPKSAKKKKKTGEREKETEKKGVAVQQSQVKFADIGGNDSTLKEICKLLVHMKHPEVYTQLGVTPPRGFLLHGPPGCGKTLLAHAVAGELEMPFLKLASTEIVSGVSGESEEKIRDLFEKARASAPCVLFIDEIDAITQKRETASKDMERRIVSQLLTCMDDLNSAVNAPVLVIGATNRADSLDPALRRAGRFDREISLGIPNEAARKSILEVMCRGLRLADDFDYEQLARDTPGFVGADLQSLAREAAMTAVNRIFNQIENESKQKLQACNNITLDETQTDCELIVIDNDVNAIDVVTTDVVIADIEIEDVEDITEVSKKDEICSTKKTVNDCRDTVGDCRDTVNDCKETESDCKETVSDCKETESDCKETVSDCKETVSDSKETVSDCKETEKDCKDTERDCKETDTDCKETESNCKETVQDCKDIGSDDQNIPNDTKNLSGQTETNTSSDETSLQECNVSELKSDSNCIKDNGQQSKDDDKNKTVEVNKIEDTKENGNSKNCTLAANSSPKEQFEDSSNNQSDGVSHNASNVSNSNENEKQTDVEIINIDGSNLDNSIEEINDEKTNTKSFEKQSGIIGNETASRSEISMEVDDIDLITTVEKMDQIGTQSKEPESGEIEILLETIEADADDSSNESDGDDIADVIEPTEKEQLNSVLSWLRDSPPLSMEQLENLAITKQDFKDALKVVQPSAKREGFATIPDVTWDDIGALMEVREELQMAILAPVRHPEQFRSLGLTNPPGILLAGPPGCGKTLLAKAIANESGINFISVKGPELLNMYVGESERAVRQVFQRARNSCPCVIFFDELDALCPKRSHGGEGGSSVRVVNQLLTEMDGLEERKQVYIMAATNRPDIIDPAIMRPGRLDKLLFVGMPTVEDRIDILNAITKNGTKPRFQDNVCLKEIAGHEQCGHYTGADLAALVREASVVALKEFIASGAGSTKSPIRVGKQHFEVAFHKVKPSVSQKDKAMYDRLKMRSATD